MFNELNVYAALTVSIWLAGLDYSGRMQTDRQVRVCVLDPRNTTVQCWHKSLLWTGLNNFLFELSDQPPEGRWTVQVTIDLLTVHRQFDVAVRTDVDSVQAAASPPKPEPEPEPEAALLATGAESHFVELNFSRRTALLVRPGSPFAGEVSAP